MASGSTGVMGIGQPVVQISKLTKGYPGVLALQDFDLEIFPGTITALVGENGAGKSTAVKLIAGAEAPTSGTISIGGSSIGGRGPSAARNAGIRIVYQEMTMIPTMSALDNVFLGQQPTRRRWFTNSKSSLDQFRQLSSLLGVNIPPDALLSGLSVAESQSLEILRALQAKAKVLILDEPTASIPVTERERLYDVIRGLSNRGVAIILVSHNLDEVLSLADTVTVLRAGRLVRSAPSSDWTKQSIVSAMLGRDGVVHQLEQREGRPRLGNDGCAPALRVDSMRVRPDSPEVSFSVYSGEILGLAGLVGSGRSSILQVLGGASRPAAGRMQLKGQSVGWPRSPRLAITSGIVLAPEDRKGRGITPNLTGTDNLTLPRLKRVSVSGFISRHKSRLAGGEIASMVGISPPMLLRRASELSGGNQQKVVLGKWALSQSNIYLIDEPTRGVDIGAKQEIYAFIRSLADGGAAVVLVSSELEELVANCDRILTVARGQITGEFTGSDRANDRLLPAMFKTDHE